MTYLILVANYDATLLKIKRVKEMLNEIYFKFSRLDLITVDDKR